MEMGQYVVVKKFATNYRDGADVTQLVGTVGATVTMPVMLADTMPSYVVPVGSPQAVAIKAGEDPETATSIYDLSVGEAVDFVSELATVAQLDDVEAVEKKNEKYPNGRVGVLRAIAAKRAELLGV